MSTPRDLRVALIGQGFMGRAHSNAWQQVGRFFDIPHRLHLQVICGRDRARLEKMASIWGWAAVETDWRRLIDRPDIDAIDICAPNALHAPIAIAAAQAGKMVLCEKPMAISAEEGAAMAAAARSVPTMVWFNYRRIPAVAFSRRLIEEDRLGRIFHYRASYLQESGADPTRPPSWKTEKASAGSGALGDLLSHIVDMALYLNGPIREVCGILHTFAENRDVDDAALLLARFANGSLATFEATKYAVGCRNRHGFEIHGSSGMLRFNFEDMHHLEYMDARLDRKLQGPSRLLVTGPDHPYWTNFWKPGHVTGYEHTFIAALGDFLRSLESGEAFHPNFEDAQQVQRVLAAVETSALEGRWVTAA